MSDQLVVGNRILDEGLVVGGDAKNLKNSSYNLTIGTIIPIGKDSYKDRKKNGFPKKHFIEPREMVIVLSEEEFLLPNNITGLVTLRTSLTKVGLHALDVGIVDPFYKGPISTALLNFSDRPVEIEVGQAFFRVLFLSHDEVDDWRPEKDESTNKKSYTKMLEDRAYGHFPRTYLNMPSEDDEFYYRNFWKLVRFGLSYKWKGMFLWLLISAIFASFVWFVLSETTYWSFVWSKWESITSWFSSPNPRP